MLSKCYELLKEDLQDISISMAKNPKLVQMFISKNLSKSLPDRFFNGKKHELVQTFIISVELYVYTQSIWCFSCTTLDRNFIQ